jgi:hypothetical protein
MKYKLGDKVWVKPVDAGDLEGVVIGFTKIEPILPIVEFEYAGYKSTSVFDLHRIRPHAEGKVEPVYIRIV